MAIEKADYTVNIESADNGIVVRVGCKILVIVEDNIDEALADIKLYLTGGYKARRVLDVKYLKETDCDQLEPCAAIQSEPTALNAGTLRR